MGKSRWRLCGIVAAAAAACLFLGWKTVTINQKYPQQEVRRIQAGESAPLQGGVSLRVEKIRWRTKEEAKGLYGEGFTSEMDDGDTYRTLEVEIELTNKTAKDQDIFLHGLYLEKGAYEQGLAPEVFYSVNDSQDMDFKMPGGSTRKVTLGYVLFDFQFRKRQWEKVESLEFGVADTKYPVKTVWML